MGPLSGRESKLPPSERKNPISLLAAFYRCKETVPILALSALPFISSGMGNPGLFLADLLVSFLALSFAYSINEFFDSKGGEANGATDLSRKIGIGKTFLLSAFSGIAAILSTLFFGFSNPARLALLLFLLVFFTYSAEFPRGRNMPGIDFFSNILGFYLIFLKSSLLYPVPKADFLSFSIFVISFYSVSEAVHELSHRKMDLALGRLTFFGILGRRGAILLSFTLIFLPLLFWNGMFSIVSAFFSTARFLSLNATRDSSEEYSSLRARLYGREELALLAILSAIL